MAIISIPSATAPQPIRFPLFDLQNDTQADTNTVLNAGDNISIAQQSAQQGLLPFQQNTADDADALNAQSLVDTNNDLNALDAAIATADGSPLGQALTADALNSTSISDLIAQSQVLATDLAPDDTLTSPVDELAAALEAGDITAAQDAFDELFPSSPQNSDPLTNSAATNPFADEFAALNDALDSGDLLAARNASTQLQQDIEATPARLPLGGLTTSLDNANDLNTVSPGDEIQTAFADLADAITAGDITTAQGAFEAFRDELQAQQNNRFASNYSRIATLNPTVTASLSISV